MHVVCLHATQHEDPMYEVMRWHDTMRIYREYYSKPSPNSSHEQQKDESERIRAWHSDHPADDSAADGARTEQAARGDNTDWIPYNARAEAETAIAMSDKIATQSQSSQCSQDIDITPLADRVEQVRFTGVTLSVLCWWGTFQNGSFDFDRLEMTI